MMKWGDFKDNSYVVGIEDIGKSWLKYGEF